MKGNHYELTNGVVTKYYFAGTQRIAMRKNGVLTYMLSDHLGSTSLITDVSGNVLSETRYSAWGEIRYQAGTMSTGYGFNGQFSYQSDFGLLFYNARFYDAALGRFSSTDTIVPEGNQGMDRYAYANNSPSKYQDPDGHKPIDPEEEENDKVDCSDVPLSHGTIEKDVTINGNESFDFVTGYITQSRLKTTSDEMNYDLVNTDGPLKRISESKELSQTISAYGMTLGTGVMGIAACFIVTTYSAGIGGWPCAVVVAPLLGTAASEWQSNIVESGYAKTRNYLVDTQKQFSVAANANEKDPTRNLFLTVIPSTSNQGGVDVWVEGATTSVNMPAFAYNDLVAPYLKDKLCSTVAR